MIDYPKVHEQIELIVKSMRLFKEKGILTERGMGYLEGLEYVLELMEEKKD